MKSPARPRTAAVATATFVTLFLGFPEPSHAAIAPSWSNANRQRLSAGGVALFPPSEPPANGARLAGAILVNATREEVWAVISNPGSQPQFLSNVKRADVIQTSPRSQLVDHRIKLGFLPITLSYRYQTRQVPLQRIDFHRVSGEVREFEGRWVLHDSPSLTGKPGTVVFYELYLDLGKVIPQEMVRKNLQKDLPEMLTKLRQRVYTVR